MSARRLLQVLWLLAVSFSTSSAAMAQNTLGLYSKPIIADISENLIEIHSQFDGKNLLLYGARNAPGDIIAVITGPYSDIILSRKGRVAGMWMQVERAKLRQTPLYFATASTKPIDIIAPPKIIAQLQLTYPDMHEKTNEVMAQAISSKLVERGWVNSENIPIQYFGETLFRVQLPFPNNMPRGQYTVDVFLVDERTVIASQTIPFQAVKTGLDFWLYDHAHRFAWWYGAGAILLSLFGGWLGSRMVKRR